MGAYNLRRLCRPEILRSIDSEYLEQLLVPHADYLADHGVALPLVGRDSALKYMALVRMFIAPDIEMPQDLFDAIYFIDELATPSGVEAIETAAQGAGIRLGSPYDQTPAEVVLQLWLKNRSLVERIHAEAAVRRHRSYHYYQPITSDAPQLPGALDRRVGDLEAELNECYEMKRRGRHARVLVDEQEEYAWFYVAHGDLMKREGTIDETGPSSVCYRPEVYDAVVLIKDTGELGIHAKSHWERDLLRSLVGQHLFDDASFFGGTAKYTLAPLSLYRRQALQCIDVPGIEWVRLVQLTTFLSGRMPRTESHKSDDLFLSWEATGPTEFPSGRIVSAGFRVKILGCRTARMVTIRPSNQIQYSRDVDRQWVERWLKKRGFIGGAGDADATVLAVA